MVPRITICCCIACPLGALKFRDLQRRTLELLAEAYSTAPWSTTVEAEWNRWLEKQREQYHVLNGTFGPRGDVS